MKITVKYQNPDYYNYTSRKLRLVFSIIIAIFSACFVLSTVICIMFQDIMQLIWMAVSAIIVSVFAFSLKTHKKNVLGIMSKQENSQYRPEEIEFLDDAVTYNAFNYYAASFFHLKYSDIISVVFKRNAVYVCMAKNLHFGFSRADMTDSEETALIEFLKNKLSLKQFNSAKITEKDISACKEYTFIPETATVNMFPEVSATFPSSVQDIIFASTHNVIDGKKINVLPLTIIAMIITAIYTTVLPFINPDSALFDYFPFILLLLIGIFAFSLFLAALFIFCFPKKRLLKTTEKIEKYEAFITDYFITYTIYYKSGTIFGTKYNLAAFNNGAEFKDYIILPFSNGFVVIPKSALGYDIEVVRQILYKELREKFRSFPDK